MRIGLILFYALISQVIGFTSVAADEFKVKLQIEMVDHSSPENVKVRVFEKGNLIQETPVNAKGDADFKLEKGRLYEVWIVKEGWFTHVLHNVHDEGDSKHDVMLFKGISVSGFDARATHVNRTFVEVKGMNVPVEYLGDSVAVISLAELSKEQQEGLGTIEKTAKFQKKQQKKIDQLLKKKEKLEADILDLEASIKEGTIDGLTGEKSRLKLQKELVAIERNLVKYAY